MSNLDLFGNPIEHQSETALSQEESFHLVLDEPSDNVVTEEAPRHSIVGGLIVMVLISSLLLSQFFNLQIINVGENLARAQGNSVRIITTPANRGLITDRNGQVLAQNDVHTALAINPQTLPQNRDEREAVYNLLAEKVGLTQEEADFIENARLKSPELLAVRSNLTKEESLLYFEWFHATPGVQVAEIPVRKYSEIPSMGHVLG